jgi:hypothetical protein
MSDNNPVRERLQAWRVDAPVSDAFQATVWARIREREKVREMTGWADFMGRLFSPCTEWKLAAVTAVLMVAAGASLGNITGVSTTERERAHLERRYVQSVDPYLQMDHIFTR